MGDATKVTPKLIRGRDVTVASNAHFCWGDDPNSYHPPEEMAQQFLDWGIDVLRERWFPNNKAQQKAFSTFCAGGGKWYVIIGAMDAGPDDITHDMQTWRSSKFVDYTFGLCGPNEPNGSGNDVWQDNLPKKYKNIFANRVSGIPVSVGALMRNVKDYVGDLHKLQASGLLGEGKAERGDFHYYPGTKGPVDNEREAQMVRDECFGGLDLIESETGWTTGDGNISKDQQDRWIFESLLRSHLRGGMALTINYEALDNVGEEGKHSGNFGCDWTTWVQPFKRANGDQEFPGWIASGGDPNTTYDGTAVATNGADGAWTLYLLSTQGTAQKDYTLALPQGYSCSLGKPTKTGDGGNNKWANVAIADTMTVVTVTKD